MPRAAFPLASSPLALHGVIMSYGVHFQVLEKWLGAESTYRRELGSFFISMVQGGPTLLLCRVLAQQGVFGKLWLLTIPEIDLQARASVLLRFP